MEMDKMAEQDGILQFHIPLFEISYENGQKLRDTANESQNIYL